jgi:hypothetical protein
MSISFWQNAKAVLIGTGNFAYDNSLTAIQNVENNINDLENVLTDSKIIGIPKENITKIFDGNSTFIKLTLQRIVAEQPATLLIYYTGHGVRENGSLYLTGNDTIRQSVLATGIKITDFHDIIKLGSNIDRKVVILDCCYSGLAIGGELGDDLSKLDVDIDIHGTYTLASSPGNRVSKFDDEQRNTEFTGAFINILKNGLDNHNNIITLDNIYSKIRADFVNRNNHGENIYEPMKSNKLNVPDFPFANNPQFLNNDKLPSEQTLSTETNKEKVKEKNIKQENENFSQKKITDKSSETPSLKTFLFEFVSNNWLFILFSNFFPLILSTDTKEGAGDIIGSYIFSLVIVSGFSIWYYTERFKGNNWKSYILKKLKNSFMFFILSIIFIFLFTQNQSPQKQGKAPQSQVKITTGTDKIIKKASKIVYCISILTNPGAEKSEIYTVNQNGTENNPLTSLPGDYSIEDVSKDGKKILFIVNVKSKWDIYSMELNSKNMTPITSDGKPKGHAKWSPDGKVYFSKKAGIDWESFIINVDGSNLQPIAKEKANVNQNNSRSPDGKKILFQSETKNNLQGLFIMNTDDKKKVHIMTKLDSPYYEKNRLTQAWLPQ